MDSIHRRIIALLQILTSAPTQSAGFELPENTFEQHQIKKHEALRELARLQSNPAIWRMFASLNRDLPDGTRDQVLRAAQKLANLLLPVFVKARFEEAKLTNYAKYLREAATRNPFLENASLTRDAFSGMGEVENDSWADGVNLERRH